MTNEQRKLFIALIIFFILIFIFFFVIYIVTPCKYENVSLFKATDIKPDPTKNGKYLATLSWTKSNAPYYTVSQGQSNNFQPDNGFIVVEKTNASSVVVSDLSLNTIVYFSIFGTNLEGTCQSDITYMTLHVIPTIQPINVNNNDNSTINEPMIDNDTIKYNNMMALNSMKNPSLRRCTIPKIV